MMTKLLAEEVCLKRNYINSKGNSIWSVTPNGTANFPEFRIHVTGDNNVITFFFFNSKKKGNFVDANYVAAALHEICEFLLSQGGNTPRFYCKSYNKFLYTVAKKSGMHIIHMPKNNTLTMLYSHKA